MAMTFDDLAKQVSDMILTERKKRGMPTPMADAFSAAIHQFAVRAGDNKMRMVNCPTCGKPPTMLGNQKDQPVFMFRDQLSVTEYGISGMCQECQDNIFKKEEGDV